MKRNEAGEGALGGIALLLFWGAVFFGLHVARDSGNIDAIGDLFMPVAIFFAVITWLMITHVIGDVLLEFGWRGWAWWVWGYAAYGRPDTAI